MCNARHHYLRLRLPACLESRKGWTSSLEPVPQHGVAAVAAALHPVFLTAAAVMLGAFGLSWRQRDVPLRETAGSVGIGEGFAAPRPASSEG